MNFCPKCGTMLQVAKKGTIRSCPKCKYQKIIKQEEIKQKIKVPFAKSAEIAVIDKKIAALRQLSTVKVVCLKCSHTESETWTVETANETIHSTITFFRCTNCGATRREAG